MSDDHRGLPHDLPARKAKVYKEGLWWRWEHACSDRPPSTPVISYPQADQGMAMRGALRHLAWCA